MHALRLFRRPAYSETLNGASCNLLLIHVVPDKIILTGLGGSSHVELPVSYDSDNSYRHNAR